jgi:DnaK suppressor protein
VLSESKGFARTRERLLARQVELGARREQLIADRRRLADPLSADAPDRAIQQENDEVIDSIEASVETEALAIVGALRRLDEGSYGVCETCGAEISPKRLEVVPYAQLCQSCAAQANS